MNTIEIPLDRTDRGSRSATFDVQRGELRVTVQGDLFAVGVVGRGGVKWVANTAAGTPVDELDDVLAKCDAEHRIVAWVEEPATESQVSWLEKARHLLHNAPPEAWALFRTDEGARQRVELSPEVAAQLWRWARFLGRPETVLLRSTAKVTAHRRDVMGDGG